MRRSWILGACAVALLLLVLIVVGSDDPDGTALELVRILLGWPVVVGALLVGFGIVFRDELSEFLGNIWKVRLPGGTELERQPAPPEIDETNLPEDELETPTPAAVSAEAFEVLFKIAVDRHRDSLYWYFMYLNQFLVQTTKEVLIWIGSLEGVTKDLYEATWAPRLPTPIQRASTLNALLQTDLVEETGGLLRITDRGRRYLLFMAGKFEEAVTGTGPTRG